MSPMASIEVRRRDKNSALSVIEVCHYTECAFAIRSLNATTDTVTPILPVHGLNAYI